MFTLIVTAGISAIMFLIGVNIPSMPDQTQLVSYQTSMLRHSNTTLLSLNATNNALATPNADLAANITRLASTSSRLVNSRAWLDGSAVTGLFNNVNWLNGNNTVLKWGN